MNDGHYKFKVGEDIETGDHLVLKGSTLYRIRADKGDKWNGLRAAEHLHKGAWVYVSTEHYCSGIISAFDA